MRTIVLKLGGAVCAEPDTVARLADTVRALQAEGLHVTVVHGGGPQLDIALRERFGEPVKHRGLRVTPPAAAAVVRDVLDDIGANLAAMLEAEGLATRHVAGRQGRLVAAAKGVTDAVDLQRVGEVVGFTAAPEDVAHGKVTIVTPVGADRQGPLNVNADEGAAAIARALAATGLVLVTDVDAVRDADGNPWHELDAAAAVGAIESGAAQGGMIPKLTGARTALAAGVPWVWIGRLDAEQIMAAMEAKHTSGTLVTNEPLVKEH